MEQRDIFIVRYPFSDPLDYKIRPALIISNNIFNKKFYPLICPITTKKHDDNIQINDCLEEGNLSKESFVKISVIATMHPELILKKIGKLNKKTFTKIKSKFIENL
jgi:mRNA-degrading endonuclease toxin of MazEF toxin-antitoxin module